MHSQPCARCQGQLFQDHLFDMESSGILWLQCWRCLQCGARFEAGMERNRARQREAAFLVLEAECIAERVTA